MTSELLTSYIAQYGYIGIYFLLAISVMGFPMPDEFLLTLIGFLSYSQQLNPVFAIIAAATGSMTGITIAYFLGRFFDKRVLSHLKKHSESAKFEKLLGWYQRHGGKLLTIGYFIPGVRHLSGYVSGLSRMSYREFAFFAYLGASLWAALFVTLGRVLGSKWESILPIIEHYTVLLGVGAALLVLLYYVLRKYHRQLGVWFTAKAGLLAKRYSSLGKRRFLVTVAGLIFVVLFITLMSLIEDIANREVGQFDTFVTSWLQSAFSGQVIDGLGKFQSLGSTKVLFIIFLLSAGILRYFTKRWGHVIPLSLAWAGGAVIDQLFGMLFRGESLQLFQVLEPSQPDFLIAGLSFSAALGYLLAREAKLLGQVVIFVSEFALFAMIGLSLVFSGVHLPSTAVASLTVSGLWAIVSVFVYELWFSFRYPAE